MTARTKLYVRGLQYAPFISRQEIQEIVDIFCNKHRMRFRKKLVIVIHPDRRRKIRDQNGEVVYWRGWPKRHQYRAEVLPDEIRRIDIYTLKKIRKYGNGSAKRGFVGDINHELRHLYQRRKYGPFKDAPGRYRDQPDEVDARRTEKRLTRLFFRIKAS